MLAPRGARATDFSPVFGDFFVAPGPAEVRVLGAVCHDTTMTDGDDFRWLDATAQADLVREGDVKPVELVDAAIARIEAAQPRAQRGHPPAVRQGARRRERGDYRRRSVPRRAVPREGRRVPHRGRPVPLRHAGAEGARLAGARRHVARPRFRAAGFVFGGKTNTPELATSVTTEPLAYGADAQPVGPRHAAPAVRAAAPRPRSRPGIVPVAHGNDMGGSIRFPASDVRHRRAQADPRPHDARPRLRRVLGPAHARVRAHPLGARHRRGARRGRGPGPATRTPRRRRVGRTATRSARRRDGCASGSARAAAATAGRGRTPTASPRWTHRGALLESLGHDVEPVELAALDAPVPNTFGTVMCAAIARDVERWSERTGRAITDDDVEPQQRDAGADRPHDQRTALRRRDRRRCNDGRAACRHGGTTTTCSCCRRARAAGAGSASSTRQDRGRRAAWAGWWRSRCRSTSPASPRSRCRCTGTAASGDGRRCRSACSSSPRTAGKTCCCAWPRSSRRRRRGPTAARLGSDPAVGDRDAAPGSRAVHRRAHEREGWRGEDDGGNEPGVPRVAVRRPRAAVGPRPAGCDEPRARASASARVDGATMPDRRRRLGERLRPARRRAQRRATR